MGIQACKGISTRENHVYQIKQDMQLMQLMYRISVIKTEKGKKKREKNHPDKNNAEGAGGLSGSAKATGAVCRYAGSALSAIISSSAWLFSAPGIGACQETEEVHTVLHTDPVALIHQGPWEEDVGRDPGEGMEDDPLDPGVQVGIQVVAVTKSGLVGGSEVEVRMLRLCGRHVHSRLARSIRSIRPLGRRCRCDR